MTRLYIVALFAMALTYQGCAWVLGGFGLVGVLMHLSNTMSPFQGPWTPYLWVAGAIGFQGFTFIVGKKIMGALEP